MTSVDLIADIASWLRAVAPDAHLSSDSRSIAAGDVFFAYSGDGADGREYIADAIGRGAVAVLAEAADGFAWDERWQVSHRAVTDLCGKAGPIARAFYGKPDADMFSVAVTGTNGKTSCSQWLGSALSQSGAATVVVGTLGVGMYEHGLAGEFEITGYTTPDAVMLQRKLAESRAAGATALAIEASSIGLHQGRLNGVHVDTALFTNFTRDHLDYHGDMEAYEDAKAVLFDRPELKHAVINLDDEMGLRLIERLRQRVTPVSIIGYTVSGRVADGIATLRASDIRSIPTGTAFQLDSVFGTATLKTQLIGQFNVSNVLGIAGVLVGKGLPWAEVIRAVEALRPVPGRMQQLGGQDAPLVVIDYAHTPDALEKTLTALGQVARQRHGQLWCVFGCGGDRDAGKRAEMGLVSANADHVVVTSDNPRTENVAVIIAQIVEGLRRSKLNPAEQHVIEDRAAAILWAIKHAARTDVVLLAGKGHENYQEINGRKLPFLDADHASLALAARATRGKA